jgi:hypothetical protein
MRKWFSVAMALALCLVVAFGAAAAASASKSASPLVSKSMKSLTTKIVRECTTPSMTQFEKAIALYDWLIDHTVYKGRTTNPYTVLRYGVASCGGYASAYRDLLAKVGIKSKTIDGRIYGLGHTWNLVYLGGKWYHVDVRIGDLLEESEGRYRRFGMNDEQARLYYSFKGNKSSAYAYNYAYQTGRLNSAIAYVRNAVTARVGAGDKLFVVDLTASGAPSELNDPFNRITVKDALQNILCAYPGIPDKAKVALSLKDNLLLANVTVPTYRISKMSLTMPANIVVEVAGTDFAKAAPLEMADKVLITPSYATQKKLFWKSYQEKIATIDQNGRVKIRGFGIARIQAVTVDGSGVSCSYYLTVKQKKAE